MVGIIEQPGVPALRIGFTLAVLALVFIWRRRHQFFERDSNVENDDTAAHHNRLEEILFVWGGRTLALFGILYQVWST
jgi:hypothetical protein